MSTSAIAIMITRLELFEDNAGQLFLARYTDRALYDIVCNLETFYTDGDAGTLTRSGEIAYWLDSEESPNLDGWVVLEDETDPEYPNATGDLPLDCMTRAATLTRDSGEWDHRHVYPGSSAYRALVG